MELPFTPQGNKYLIVFQGLFQKNGIPTDLNTNRIVQLLIAWTDSGTLSYLPGALCMGLM